MNSNIIDYIILALIFAVVIHVFIRTFGGKCKGKEHMEEAHIPKLGEIKQQPSANLFDVMHKEERTSAYPIQSDMMPTHIEQTYIPNLGEIKQPSDVMHKDERTPVHSMQTNAVSTHVDQAINKIANSKKPECPVNEMDNAIDKYIKRYVLPTDRENIEHEPVPFSNEEIKGHQNQFFAFEPTLNRSSNEGVDVVDKLNELQVVGNNEFVKEKGKKISEVFDELTKHQIDTEKQCKYPKCIIPPKTFNDDEPVYLDSEGLTFSRSNWKYETDEVNNGGKFYNDIEAYDVGSESNMVVV